MMMATRADGDSEAKIIVLVQLTMAT